MNADATTEPVDVFTPYRSQVLFATYMNSVSALYSQFLQGEIDRDDYLGRERELRQRFSTG